MKLPAVFGRLRDLLGVALLWLAFRFLRATPGFTDGPKAAVETPRMKRTAAKWIRGEVDRQAIAEGCYFDEAAANRACLFIESVCRQSQGRWRGKLIVLLPWQRDFIMRLFGWKRKNGLRRYRSAYLEVAKKNGKSTLLSAIALYLLMADGEGAPAVYLNACDRDQATIIFGEAARMIASSPGLSSRLEVIDSKADRRIKYPDADGVIVANSSVAGAKDGLNPSGIIFDELHRQPDRQLWAVFEFASAAREQPLTLSITTAGESDEGVWHEQRELSEKINAGEIPDTSHLGVVYRATEDDPIDDPKTWFKANPSLGETIKLDDFAADLAKSKLDPAKLANFKRLRLGIIQREEVKFLGPGMWDACSEEPFGELEYFEDDDRPTYVGFDLASVDDLAAVAMLVGDDEDGFDVVWKYYLPEANILDLERRHRRPYRVWAGLGLITLTPGSAIDYKFIRRDIVKLTDGRNLKFVLGDPYAANGLIQQLEQEDGLPAMPIRQGFLSLSPPTKELYRLVAAGKLRHGGHPISRWMAGNAVASKDEAENIKLSKTKSRHKIDGIAALVNALAGTIGQEPEPTPGFFAL